MYMNLHTHMQKIMIFSLESCHHHNKMMTIFSPPQRATKMLIFIQKKRRTVQPKDGGCGLPSSWLLKDFHIKKDKSSRQRTEGADHLLLDQLKHYTKRTNWAGKGRRVWLTFFLTSWKIKVRMRQVLDRLRHTEPRINSWACMYACTCMCVCMYVYTSTENAPGAGQTQTHGT